MLTNWNNYERACLCIRAFQTRSNSSRLVQKQFLRKYIRSLFFLHSTKTLHWTKKSAKKERFSQEVNTSSQLVVLHSVKLNLVVTAKPKRKSPAFEKYVCVWFVVQLHCLQVRKKLWKSKTNSCSSGMKIVCIIAFVGLSQSKFKKKRILG